MKIPNYFNKIGISNELNSSNIPLTFTAKTAGSTITLNAYGSPTTSGLQYRYGTSGGWSIYTCGTTLTLENVGNCIQFQNTEETLSTLTSKYVRFSMTGKIAASGNIQSMLNYSDSCSTCCYYSMFQGCTSLTSAPQLPATTLANTCYRDMFRGCTSLTSAPELPATTLVTYCYYQMFYGCTSLTSAPELPATTLVNFCYNSMFYGCTSLTSAPQLPATTLATYCYQLMFYGCTSLTSAPQLPATTLANTCYMQMFQGCTSLTSAPQLPATTLANNCYNNMFNNCYDLNYIKVNFTEWHSNATYNWVYGVSSTGTFEAPSELSPIVGTSNIPEGWYLPNYQYIIFVEDQKIFSKYNNEINYNIDYLLQPETLQPTFTIVEGSLPNGLTLSSDGKITGTSTEEFDGNVVIQISCEGCESVTMTLTLDLYNAIETENNLTSNTSNELYEVSQSSEYLSYYAWKAMDGSASTYSRTIFDSSNDGWWQIKFNEGPVILKYITGTFQAYNASNTLYLDVSNDGETFENVTSFTGGSDLIIKLDLTTPYQYYRIRNAKNNYYTQISEIKFLYNYAQNFLAASDQNCTFKMNEENEYQIEYMNFSETPASFSIIDGTLPEGINFDTATGKFSGTATEEFEGTLTIQISNTYYTVQIQINMKVIDTSVIPDNLLFYAPLQNYEDATAITDQELIRKGTLANATIDGKNCVYFDNSCIYSENMGFEGHVSFTQSLWFNLKEKNTSDNIILTMGNTSLYGTAHIKIQNNYVSYYTMRAGGWAMDYDPPTQFQYNKWYHLVQTYDNSTSTFKFYVNGVQVATSVCYDLYLINYRIVIGAFAALDQFIDKSYISDVKIYNTCLSDDEVKNLYQEQ